MADKSVFATLNAIDVSEHTEVKDTGKKKLTYLSWAWAWTKVKENYPNATYTVYENADGWNYFTDGKTCWVKTGVTIEGLEHIEYLPVMDYKNSSIPADLVTSFDVNKAIQRSLTKAAARHGLGLYIYAGEDLPTPAEYKCAHCGNTFTDGVVAEKSMKRWGKYICKDCIKKKQEELKKNAVNKAEPTEVVAEPVPPMLQSEGQIKLPFEI